MRKLTKKALSLVLCVMLVASAISCVFSLSAETVGTTTVPGKGWVVYDAPVGLELNGDMSTWINNNIAKSGTPLYVSENGVLRAADGMLEVNAWEEVGPARFKIPGAVAGTKVKISFDYNVNLDNLATEALKTQAKGERLTSYMFRLYNKDGSTNTEGGRDLWISDSGSTISREFTLTDSDQFFRIIIGSCKSCRAAWEISNIKVEVTHPEVAEDEDLVGTTTVPGKTYVVYNEPVDLELDGDMSSWINNNIAASGTPLYVSENGVLKAADGMAEVNAWEEVGPARFKIPNVVLGSTVKISFDFSASLDNLPDDKKAIVENSSEKLLWPIFRLYNPDGSTNTDEVKDLYYKDQGTIVSKEFTITDPDQFFRIIIRSCKGCRAAWAISNITVTVTPPEEEYVELEYDDLGAPSYYGSAEGGFNSTLTTYPVRLKPADNFANLDFEAGFVYWSGQDASKAPYVGTLPSDAYKLAGEGENIYLTLKNSGYVSNIQSIFFKASNISVGDAVVLIYDAKGDDATKLRPFLRQDGLRPVEYGEDGMSTSLNPNGSGAIWNPSSGNVATDLIQVGSTQTKFDLQTGLAGWTTYVTGAATIVDPTTITSTASSDIFLQVKIGAAGVSVGDNFDAAIDNIRVAKVVDGVYTDLATGEVIYDVSNAPEDSVPSYYGSEENGFNSLQTSSWPHQLKPVDGTANLDFSKGFIYWSGRDAGAAPYNGTLASDSFKLGVEGENKYITLKDEGYVDTMRSALFKLSNVAVNDKLVLIYDAKGADAQKLRVTLYQEAVRGADQGVSYNAVTGMNSGNNASFGMAHPLVNNSTLRSELTGVTAPSGWTTYVTDYNLEVADPTALETSRPCTADIFVQIIINKSNSVSVGEQLDAAIDNIRIAKIVDGMYYDVTTNEAIAPVVDHEDPAVNAQHLADLVTAVVTGATTSEMDYNGDGKVNLLDVVFLKKWLADLA